MANLEAPHEQEERRFQRALRRPLREQLEIWFWVSRIPGVIIVLCLAIASLIIAAGGTWLRLELLRWLGWIR